MAHHQTQTLLRAGWQHGSSLGQQGTKTGVLHCPSLQPICRLKFLGIWLVSVRNSGQRCSNHILLCTIFTLAQPHLTFSSSTAAYKMKCQRLQFLSTTRGPKSTLCAMQEVFSTKPSGELVKSHWKAEFDPRTHHTHTHTEHSLAKPVASAVT